MTEEVDERVYAGVAHGKPMAEEPHDVDIFEAENYTVLSKIHCRFVN